MIIIIFYFFFVINPLLINYIYIYISRMMIAKIVSFLVTNKLSMLYISHCFHVSYLSRHLFVIFCNMNEQHHNSNFIRMVNKSLSFIEQFLFVRNRLMQYSRESYKILHVIIYVYTMWRKKKNDPNRNVIMIYQNPK